MGCAVSVLSARPAGQAGPQAGGRPVGVPDAEAAGPFAGWAAMAAGGDEGLSRALLGAVLRFRRLCGSRLIDAPAPGYAAIARVYRGLAALAADGTVATADLFHIRRLDAFLADPGERSAALSEAAWDNRATLFASRHAGPAMSARCLTTAASPSAWPCRT